MKRSCTTLLVLAVLGGYAVPAIAQLAAAGLVVAYGCNEGNGTSLHDALGNGRTDTLSGATWTAQGK